MTRRPEARSADDAGSIELPAARAVGSAYAITFVCTGNICRSPMADVIVRALVDDRGLGERVVVTSSGTGGWHVGDGADPRTVSTLARHGYDGAPHRASRFDSRLYADYDLVVAMDRSHVRALRGMAGTDEDRSRIVLLRDFDPLPGDEVPDPYYGGEADFEEVFRMVERSSESLVDAIHRRLASTPL